MGRVILTEKRELENERTEMMTDVTINNRKIKELEANLLYKLTTVTVKLSSSSFCQNIRFPLEKKTISCF